MSGADLKHRLAAILAADAAGYSRLMSLDARATVSSLDAARAVFRRWIESNQGRVIDMAGDSVLAVFETATGAVSAALAIQSEINPVADLAPQERRMLFRIGVHLGDVIEKADGTIYGDGVNITARLEGMAEPGGITVSDSIRGAVKGKVKAGFEDLGEQMVKNISDPVRAYRVQAGGVGVEAPASKPSTAIAGIDLSLPDKPSIAVLAFANKSGDPEQEYFTDGITEDIITELSRFHSLFVIARNSSFTYKGRSVDVRTVARELGVRYVLEGSIRRASDRIRVTAQLIDALSGKHIWAEKYDRVLEDIFAVQDEVTECIVAAIAQRVESSERVRAARRRPADLSAYEMALRAQALVWQGYEKSDRVALEQGLQQARAALAVDPDNLLALNSIAMAQWQNIAYGIAVDRDSAWHEGLDAVSRAIALDQSSTSHAIKAMLMVFTPSGHRWEEARVEADAGYRLNPQDSYAIFICGYLAASFGRFRDAIALLERSLRINPLDPYAHRIYEFLAMAHNAAREYDKALVWVTRAISNAPESVYALSTLVGIQVHLGELDKARSTMDTMRQLQPGLIQRWLQGGIAVADEHLRHRFTTILRIAACLEDPSAADALR